MQTTPEQRIPQIKLQTHGTQLVKRADGEVVEVARPAYETTFTAVPTMRLAFIVMRVDGVDLSTMVARRIVRGLQRGIGTSRTSGWWIHRKVKTRRSR